MRAFIRHPASVPVDIAIDEAEPGVAAATLIDISAGGLAFSVPYDIAIGSQLTVSLPDLWPDYQATGHVVWCREQLGMYVAGIQFAEANEAFKARMVAQFCQIEDYKQAIQQSEGRRLSDDEAATEWICRYAEEFAETVGWK